MTIARPQFRVLACLIGAALLLTAGHASASPWRSGQRYHARHGFRSGFGGFFGGFGPSGNFGPRYGRTLGTGDGLNNGPSFRGSFHHPAGSNDIGRGFYFDPYSQFRFGTGYDW